MRYSLLLLAIAVGCASAHRPTIGGTQLQFSSTAGSKEFPSWFYQTRKTPEPLGDKDSVIVRAISSFSSDQHHEIGGATLDSVHAALYRCGARSINWDFQRPDSIDVGGAPRETFDTHPVVGHEGGFQRDIRLAIPAKRFRKLVDKESDYITEAANRSETRSCLKSKGML